jgi:rod shape determining protein RodA
MNRTNATPLVGKLDFISVGLVVFLVVFGWLNILATVTPVGDEFQWSWDHEAGKQLQFIVLASFLILIVLLADARLFEFLAWAVYGFSLILLVAVLFFGVERGGNKSWLNLGSFGLQPSEFAKLGTALMVARILERGGSPMETWRGRLLPMIVVAVPMVLILLQPDAGSALVFSSFLLVFYFAGMPSYYLFGSIGIGVVSLLALALSPETMRLLIGSVSLLSLIVSRARKRMPLIRLLKHPAIWLGIAALAWARNN